MTSNFTPGFVVPIPTSALEVTTNTVPVVLIPKVFAVPTWSLWSGFVVPMPTDEEGIWTLLLKVEIPETLSWVTEAIPPITLVDTPAVEAKPLRVPLNVVAVITPVNLPSPRTSNFTLGFVVPIPTSALEVTTNTVLVVLIPNVFAVPTWSLWSGFVVPIPTDEEGIWILLLNVEIPETVNWVTDAIPPITDVETPALVA